MIVRIFLAKVVVLGAITLVAGCTTPDGDAGSTDDKSLPDNAQTSGESSGKPAGDVNAGSAEADASESSTDSASGDGETQYVQSWSLRVREGAGMSHPVVKHLSRGEAVTVMKVISGVWAQIGENEFVSNRFLKPTKPE